MLKHGYIFKALAVIGTILLWIPIIFPILLAIISFFESGKFRFDYLMPAELFPSALLGAIILLVCSYKAKRYRRFLTWSFFAALIFLLSSQSIAVLTGLASGDVEPTPLLLTVVLIPLAVYSLLLIVMGTSGCLLCRDIFTEKKPAA